MNGRTASEPAGGFLRGLARNVALQDVLLAAYLTLMLLAVAMGTGPDRARAMRTIVVDLACFAFGIALTRGGILPHAKFTSALVYRLTLFLTMFLSYFQLRWILPAVTPHALDAALVAFDERVFGLEPAIAWDRFVTPSTTEWFACFYFGYFVLLAAYVLPMMLNGKDEQRLAHFALGTFLVFCSGHLLYMVVPGVGPYAHLADRFAHPLEGGPFWNLVRAAVEAGGPQKDIFPSLHSAAPTYFALYAFHHRRVVPFRFAWPPTAFVATQIVVATMFLRWHYLIDVVAGVALAASGVWLGHHLAVRERARRTARGAQPIFAPLDWSSVFGTTWPAAAKRRHMRS